MIQKAATCALVLCSTKDIMEAFHKHHSRWLYALMINRGDDDDGGGDGGDDDDDGGHSRNPNCC
jgi:hypothetical protein